MPMSYNMICKECRHKSKKSFSDEESRLLFSRLAVEFHCPSCRKLLSLRLGVGGRLESSLAHKTGHSMANEADLTQPTLAVSSLTKQSSQSSATAKAAEWKPDDDSLIRELGQYDGPQVAPSGQNRDAPRGGNTPQIPAFAPISPNQPARRNSSNVISLMLDRFRDQSKTVQYVLIALIFLFALTILMIPNEKPARKKLPDSPARPFVEETDVVETKPNRDD